MKQIQGGVTAAKGFEAAGVEAAIKYQTDVAPLKGNYIDLLNIVNSPDFELTTAADIISRDTALTIHRYRNLRDESDQAGIWRTCL